MRIRRTDPTAPVSEHVHSGDILLSFDDSHIANDGASCFSLLLHIWGLCECEPRVGHITASAVSFHCAGCFLCRHVLACMPNFSLVQTFARHPYSHQLHMVKSVRGEGKILTGFLLLAGTVPFRSGERISFSYLVSQKYTNDKVQPCCARASGDALVHAAAPLTLHPKQTCSQRNS